MLDLPPSIEVSFADFAIDLSAWQPQLHPRDSHGRFRDKWGLPPAAKKIIDKILAHFSPATFKSDDHAQSYAETLAAKSKRTPKQAKSLEYATTVNGWDDIESTLRAGSTDSEHIHAMDQMMAPLANDVLVTHVMGPDSFGLPPERIGEIEEWTGQLVSDKGFMSTNLGNPMDVDTPHVTMYMVVPKGTKAVVPGGSREIILDREQPIRIMKVEADGHGGVNVTAVVQPKQGGGVHRNLGKELPGHEHAPAVDATPEEHAKRGLNPDGTPMVNPNATNPGPVPVTPAQAAPQAPEAPLAPAAPGPPIEPIKSSPGSVAVKRTVPEKTAKAPAVPAEKKAVAKKAVKKAEPAVAKAVPEKKAAPAKAVKKAVPEKKVAKKTAPTAADQAQVSKIASAFHADWQKTQPEEGSGRKPKFKSTTDKAWIDAHGTDQVDIANTHYADLPDDWQKENRDAAEVAQGILKKHGGKVDLSDEATRLAVGEEIHQAWLARPNNAYAKGGALDKPFADLPRDEQDKDTDQLKVAMDATTKKAIPGKTAKAPAVPAKASPAKVAPAPEKKVEPKPSEPIKAARTAEKTAPPSAAIKSKKEIAKAQHAETAKAEPIAQALAEVDELNAKNASETLIADHIDAIASGPHVQNITDIGDRAEVVHALKDIARDFREGKVAQGRTKLAKLGKEHGLTQQHAAGQPVKFEEGKHNDVGGTLKAGEGAVVIRPGHMQTRKDGSTVQLDKPVVKKVHAAKHTAPSPEPEKKAAAVAKKAVPAKKVTKAATPEVHAPGTELNKGPVHVQIGDTLHDYYGYKGGVVARVEKKDGRYHFYDKDGKELFEGHSIAPNGKLKFKKGAGSPDPGTELGPIDGPSESVHEPKLLKKATGHFGAAADPGENGDGYSASGKWGKFGAAGALIRAPGDDGQARYLMVQRGPSVSHNKGLWQLPGGALNGNENPYEGASREIEEEVKAHPDYIRGLKPVGEHVYEDGTGWKYTTIAADAPHTFEPKADGTETGDAKWFTAEEIKQMVADGHVTPSVKKSLLGLIDDHEATHAATKTVPTSPEAAKLAAEVKDVDLNKKYVKELKEMAAAKGIKVPSTAKKADIIKLLQGDQVAAPTPKSILTKAPTVGELKADAKSKGIKVPSSAKKADVQKLLDDHAAGKLGPEHMIGPAKPKYNLAKAPLEVRKLQAWREKVKDDPYMAADTKAIALSEGYRSWYPAFEAELAKRAWEQHGKTLDSIGWDVFKIKALFENQGGKSFDEQWKRLSEQVEKAADDGLATKTISELELVMSKEHIHAPYGHITKAKLITHIREMRMFKAKQAKYEAEAAEKLKKQLEREAVKQGIPVEMLTHDWSTLKQVGPQAGSNAGGVFEAPDGSRWYVKVQKSAEHASNEQLSAQLYEELGIDAPKVYKGRSAPGLTGDHMTATRIVPHPKSDLKQRIDEDDKKYLDKIYEGFAADAWLANWDVAGLSYDNIVTSDGQPVRIDAGGSLLYRAQGEAKGDAFGPVVTEWDTFRDPASKRSSAVLYRGITEEQMRKAGERLEKMTPKRIHKMVADAGLPPSVADTLIERRADVLSRIREKPVFEHKAVHGSKALAHAPSSKKIVKHLQAHGVSENDARAAEYAIESYTGSGYGGINRLLLKGEENDPKSSSAYKAEVHAIDTAMRHSVVSEDVIVYRGERNPSRSFPDGVWSLDGGMEGMEWTFKSFGSTSTAHGIAQSFAHGGTHAKQGAQPTVMRIRVPKGTHGVSVLHSGEEELILDRGLRYRVVADHGVSGGTRYIDVEIIPA